MLKSRVRIREVYMQFVYAVSYPACTHDISSTLCCLLNVCLGDR